MEQSGYLMRGGTIVDATIINAPTSTKNAEKSLAPNLARTRNSALYLERVGPYLRSDDERHGRAGAGVLPKH